MLIGTGNSRLLLGSCQWQLPDCNLGI